MWNFCSYIIYSLYFSYCNYSHSYNNIYIAERLPKKKHESILQYDKYYQQAGYAATGMYLLNAIFSSIVVYSNYLDSTTVTVYITNLLFMALKVADVYSTVNTKKNIFYSAYLKDKIQYNDVDPDKEISEECAIDNND